MELGAIDALVRSTTDVLQAVLSVLPLDTFDTPCSWTMQVVGDAQAVPLRRAAFGQLAATFEQAFLVVSEDGRCHLGGAHG